MQEETNSLVTTEPNSLAVNVSDLNKESLEIINQIIAETDIEKTKDLTHLFNINQNKKTMVRVNKLNELLDLITDQTIKRFSAKPDEISNQELLQSIKIVQDTIERGQKQVNGVNENTPLIQINQQNNEVNVGSGENLSKESRDKIKNVIATIMQSVAQPTTDVIEVMVDEEKED